MKEEYAKLIRLRQRVALEEQIFEEGAMIAQYLGHSYKEAGEEESDSSEEESTRVYRFMNCFSFEDPADGTHFDLIIQHKIKEDESLTESHEVEIRRVGGGIDKLLYAGESNGSLPHRMYHAEGESFRYKDLPVEVTAFKPREWQKTVKTIKELCKLACEKEELELEKERKSKRLKQQEYDREQLSRFEIEEI